jgi:hypothetical protein
MEPDEPSTLVLDALSVVSSVAFWSDGVVLTLADGSRVVLKRDIVEGASAKMRAFERELVRTRRPTTNPTAVRYSAAPCPKCGRTVNAGTRGSVSCAACGWGSA